MSTWIWALTFTVLGSAPEHGVISKYQTRQDCESALQMMKVEYKQQGKSLVGACKLVLKLKPE